MIATTTNPSIQTVLIVHGEWIRLETFTSIVEQNRAIALDKSILERCEQSNKLLHELLRDEVPIYGTTTGFGPLVSESVETSKSTEHQQNLISHLACGLGPLFSERQSRAIFLTRILSLCQARSAVSTSTLQNIVSLFNKCLIPCMPQLGTVGASGDLTPLAHAALALTGRGEIWSNGQVLNAKKALAQANQAPMKLEAREGLALVNGTAAMTGVAALNAATVKRLWTWALRLALLYSEIHQAKKEAFAPFVGKARKHTGQQKVHALLANWTESGSRLTGSENSRKNSAQRPLQDVYSLRCIPQLFGAVWEVIANHECTVETEFNAATDNPLFSIEDETVYHNGNFYGLPIALSSDSLINAVLNIAIHAERSIAKTTDRLMNGHLPAFLVPDKIGLNSGFMGVQTTATALLAEMRSSAHAASIQSIPTNANNQDIIPLGTISARKANEELQHLSRILAIEALVFAQAYDLIISGEPSALFSNSSLRLVAWVRERSSFLDTDRPLSKDIEDIAIQLTQACPD